MTPRLPIPLASPAPAGEVALPQAVTEGVFIPSPRGVAGETSRAQAIAFSFRVISKTHQKRGQR